MLQSDISGVLALIKPPGPSSQELVTDVKRVLKIKKVGHAGTLDPAAAGVLPICLGKATRLFDYLIEKDKSYRCEITFGIATDTIDSYGTIIETDENVNVSIDEFVRVIDEFQGEIRQKPPLFSALKIGGKKLYEIARSGTSAEIESDIRAKKERNVFIHKISFVEQLDKNRFMFDVECSKGTYIRVLCEDIAKKLATVGYMSFLLRTKSAGIDISNGISLDEMISAFNSNTLDTLIIPMGDAIDHLAKIELDNRFYADITNGRKIKVNSSNVDSIRIYCNHEFLGIGSIEDRILRVKSLLI